MVMGQFQTVSAKEALTLIQSPETLILDCRDLKDYRAGHIDNALHVHQQLLDKLLTSANKQRPLLFYCYYGHASEHVAAMFGDFGFQQVYSLAGGYAGWHSHSD